MQTEAQFQSNVLALIRAMGLVVYHTHDSRRSEPGFPDLVIVGNGILYRELKTDRGRVSPDQTFWLQALAAAGQDVRVWRPSADWPTNIRTELQALGRCTAQRPLPTAAQLRRHLQGRAPRRAEVPAVPDERT